jgi:hypothetical protein
MLIIFFGIKEIVHNEFVLAGQTVSSLYCFDVLLQLHENVQRFNLNLGDKKLAVAT